MATPTILIGMGSSGLYMLEHAQRFHYENFGVNRPEHVVYMYIETNKDNRVGVTALPNEVKRVFVSLEQMSEMSRTIKEDGANWIPPHKDLLNSGLGAGGKRPFGRIGLWGRNNQGNNFRNVAESISEAHSALSKYSEKPVVFICGTLTGGTGSATYIDMAYLVRNVIPRIKEVYGLMLLPPKPIDIMENAQYYANTFAALNDLSRFNHRSTVYKEKWPTEATPVEFAESPFELVQFISQDYLNDNVAMKSLDGLYKMAGMYLFLNMIGMKEKRTERLVDATIGKYGSFGLSAIHYPKDQIEEYIALTLGIELLQRWAAKDHYIVNNEKRPVNRDEIKKLIRAEWGAMLESAFKLLDNIGADNIDLLSEDEAIKINKKEIDGAPKPYMTKLFSSNHGGNWYGIVKNNLQIALDSLIEQIHDSVVAHLNEKENITYARFVLNGFEEAIEETLRYWNKIKLSSKSTAWESLLAEQVNWMNGPKFKSILEHDRVLKDRLLSTFELMKMHLMIPKLQDLIKHISKVEVPLESSQTDKALPKVAQFKKLQIQIEEIASGVEGQFLTLKKRQEEIKFDIDDDTIPVERVFASSSFQKDVKSGYDRYKQRKQSSFPSREDIMEEDLWNFLTTKAHTLEIALYERPLSAYKEAVNSEKCLPDYDLMQYVKSNPTEVVKKARLGLSGFISLNKTLTHDHYMPRFIVGSSNEQITGVIKMFREQQNFTDFKDSNNTKLELPELSNLLIFYDEKMNFVPMKDISYVDAMRTVYENKPANVVDETDQMWKRYRNCYFLAEDWKEYDIGQEHGTSKGQVPNNNENQ